MSLNVCVLAASIRVRMCFRLFQMNSFLVAGFVAGARALAAETNAFKFADVRVLIETHCYKCHNAETAKGNLDLTPLKSQQDFERDPRQLEKLVRFVREREMPPPAKRPQPKEQERQLLVDWGQFTLAHIDYEKFPRDPGLQG